MKTYQIKQHPEFQGYLNVTDLYNALKSGELVSYTQINIDDDCIKFVKQISADGFEDTECPSVLLQVLEEHVDDKDEDYLIGGLFEFVCDSNIYLYLGV